MYSVYNMYVHYTQCTDQTLPISWANIILNIDVYSPFHISAHTHSISRIYVKSWEHRVFASFFSFSSFFFTPFLPLSLFFLHSLSSSFPPLFSLLSSLSLSLSPLSFSVFFQFCLFLFYSFWLSPSFPSHFLLERIAVGWGWPVCHF